MKQLPELEKATDKGSLVGKKLTVKARKSVNTKLYGTKTILSVSVDDAADTVDIFLSGAMDKQDIKEGDVFVIGTKDVGKPNPMYVANEWKGKKR